MADAFPSRRKFLKLAPAGLLGACATPSLGNPRHIGVVGGGIVGASITYHLAKLGLKVTLLERNGLAEQASHGTFAWINASWAKQPRHYHTLSQAGVSGWHRLEEELNLRIKWGGSLEWFTSADRQARLAEQIDEQALWGEPARMVSRAELQQLEPNVNFGKANTAALSANDAAVDPVEATQALVNAAMQLGARVQTQCQVNSIASTPAGQVELQTDCGNVQVDKFVLATGADQHATQTLASIDLPQRSTPGVIVVTQPQPQLLGRIIVAPGVHIHQRLDGRVVLGEQEGAPNNQAHGQRLQQRPTRFPDKSLANQHARRILTTAREFVPKLKINQVQEVLIGWRPLPSDGHPVLGTSPYNPKAYLAIMHSGVTLAPVVGELVAKEIAEEQDLEMLAPYRPKRFVTQDSSSALLIQNHPTS